MDWGDSLNVELARRELEREASERYNGYVVKSRLKRVFNEAVKSKAIAREEVRRFPYRYIDSIKSPDGRVLLLNREIRDAFRAHFRDRFVRCPDLSLQEFSSYLADFSRLREDLKVRWRCAPCIYFPWSFTHCLYFLWLRLVSFRYNDPSPDCSGEVEGRRSAGRYTSNVHTIGV